jgi:hypothetical protein
MWTISTLKFKICMFVLRYKIIVEDPTLTEMQNSHKSTVPLV